MRTFNSLESRVPSACNNHYGRFNRLYDNNNNVVVVIIIVRRVRLRLLNCAELGLRACTQRHSNASAAAAAAAAAAVAAAVAATIL